MIHRRSRPILGAVSLTCAGVLLAALAAVLALNLPGQMSYDSVRALYQIRYGMPLTYEPPIMNVVLRVSDALTGGPSLFVAIDAVLYFTSLAVLVFVRRRASWFALAVCAPIAASPFSLLMQGTIWHDVLFADLALAGFVSLVAGVALWERPAVRIAACLSGAFLLAMAALARQNGIICTIAGLAALFFAVRSKRGGIKVWLACGVLALAAIGCANAALSLTRTNTSYVAGVKVVQSYDIVGMVHFDPRIRLTILDGGNVEIERMVHEQAAAFSPVRVDDVELHAPALWQFLMSQPPLRIREQWRRLLADDPRAYVQTRNALFSWLMLTPEVWRCLPAYVGVDGKPQWLRALGLRKGTRPQDRALYDYSARFFGTPVYSQLFYCALALAVCLFLFYRRSEMDAIVAGMLMSALIVTASYYFITLACSFRYLYFLDVAAMAGALYVAAGAPKRSA